MLKIKLALLLELLRYSILMRGCNVSSMTFQGNGKNRSHKMTGKNGCEELARKRKRELHLQGPEMKTYQTRNK